MFFQKIFKTKKSMIITLIDIIIIMFLFMFISSYYKVFKPFYKSKTKDGIRYSVYMNKHDYDKEDVMLINLKVKNKKKSKKIINLKKEIPFNIEVYYKDKLIYKRDPLDKNITRDKVLSIGGYSELNFSFMYFLENIDGDELKLGKYDLRVYSQDLNVEFELAFEII